MGTVGDRQADEGVLEDLVVATGGGQTLAEFGQLGHRQAAVLGDDRGRRCAEALAHLVDHGHLVGSRIVHRSSTGESRPAAGP